MTAVDRPHEAIVKEFVGMVRERIGPVAVFKAVTVVDRLPEMRSGKILRGVMKPMADGADFKTPATIDDQSTLDGIESALEALAYPKVVLRV